MLPLVTVPFCSLGRLLVNVVNKHYVGHLGMVRQGYKNENQRS